MKNRKKDAAMDTHRDIKHTEINRHGCHGLHGKRDRENYFERL